MTAADPELVVTPGEPLDEQVEESLPAMWEDKPHVVTGEERVARLLADAFDVLAGLAVRALESSGYDPDVLDLRAPEWRAAVAAILPAAGDVYDEGFAASARPDLLALAAEARTAAAEQVEPADLPPIVDAGPLRLAYLDELENQLVAVGDDMFDVIRTTIRDTQSRTEVVDGVERQVAASIRDVAAAVDVVLGPERWQARAVTIARTTVIAANNAGSWQSARQVAEALGTVGGMVLKEWLATTDSRTRDTHKRADGMVVRGLNATFRVGRSALLYAADPGGRPEDVINCRCTTLYHYPGDPDYDELAQRAGITAGAYLTEDDLRAVTPGAPGPEVQVTAPDGTARTLSQFVNGDDDVTTTPPEADEPCTCCGGAGEHVCGHECYVCDASGQRSAQAEGYDDGVEPDGPLICGGHHGTPDTTGREHADPADLFDPDTIPEGTPLYAEPVTAALGPGALEEPTHAGVAVQAADTGRVLLMQRALDDDDAPDVRGTWEFPGGSIEEGETPEAGAWREFSEETGLPAPEGEVTNGWRSPDGVYQGFLFTVPVEDDAWPTLHPQDVELVNPDDPQGEHREALAWFTLEQIDGLGPALRPAVRDNTPWDLFQQGPAQQPESPEEDDDMRTTAQVRAATYADDPVAVPAPAPIDQPAAVGPPPEDMSADGDPWHGVLTVEGVPTGDGRMMDPSSLLWRMLPLPLMAQDAQAPGHDGAVRVGRIDTIERTSEGRIRGAGVWDTSPAAVEAARQVGRKMLRGVSVDLDDVVVELRTVDGRNVDELTEDEFFAALDAGQVVEAVASGRISGATLCSIPAFAEAYVANGVYDPAVPEPQAVDPTALAASAGTVAAGPWSLTAATVPFPAPVDAAAFADPQLDGPTRLTVTPDGRVFGHLACWGTCHIGVQGVCQEPPASPTNYAYFLTGSTWTTEGRVPTGTLTIGTGHAGLRAGHTAAVAHYDNTGTVCASVTMGHDAHGIWFAGMLSPDATEAQVRAITAAGSVSGDWRTIGGALELVAALVVNVPGFPIPTQSVAASAAPEGLGMATALVAAGVVRDDTPGATPGVAAADVDEVTRRVLQQLALRDRMETALTAYREAARPSLDRRFTAALHRADKTRKG